MSQKISAIQVDGLLPIEDISKFLDEAKSAGATHCEFSHNPAPSYNLNQLETFLVPSEEELKQQKIEQLKAELAELEPASDAVPAAEPVVEEPAVVEGPAIEPAAESGPVTEETVGKTKGK